jgi:Protein of unknown function (DUF1681)
VERRDDCLYVDFLDKIRRDPITQQPTLYASSCIDLSAHSKNRNILNYVEQVADSSRYYTIKIVSGERSALIGFGFRERDDSVDFKEAIQFYQNSIRRQEQAMLDDSDGVLCTDDANDAGTSKLAAKYVVPKLQEGQKIHINIKKKNSDSHISSVAPSTNIKKESGLLVLRKPPPSSEQIHQTQLATTSLPLPPNVSDIANKIDESVLDPKLSLSSNYINKDTKNLDNETKQDELCQNLEDDDEEWSDFQ